MNKIENGVIRYQIDFEKYKNGQANEVVALLDDAARDVAKFIKKTGGVYTKKRYLEIARKLRDVSKSLKEGVGASIDIDGLIDYELKKQRSVLNSVKKDIEKAKGGAVNFLYPTVEQIKTSALFKPVADSMTYQSYLDGIEAGLYNMWDSAVRAGYLTGQTTQQIVSGIMGGISPQTRLMNPGIIGSLRNSVYGNTRTVLQSFAAETRNRVYRENEQYFGDTAADGERYKYEYLSTLDNRTCLVCAECGGRLYKELKDAPAIPLHRGCVLGDTLVSTTSGISKVYKRRYKGLLYRITTASGNTLTVTPNHPILTDKGFVRAHLLNVGDNVISNNGLETISIVGENKKNGQAFIKDIFSSFSKSPSMFSCTMPLSAEDFHGDAVYNKVNIITTDRELHSERNIISSKKISKNFFVNRFGLLTDKSHKCRFFQIFCSHFPAFRSLVSIFCKFGDLFWSGMSHALNLLFVPIPLRDIIFSEKSNHSGTPVTKSFSNSSYSDSLIVKFKNFINRKIVCRAFSRSFDIGSVQDVSDDVFGRTVLASNILNGYSAQIKVDNIIAIDVKFSFTHVYNLETENNWYIANGIITHNCRCILLPYFNIDGDTRASKDGYVDNVSFDEWLKEQDEKTQLDVLGRTRFEMYKNGTPITQFVDNGKQLTLEELKDKLDLRAYNGEMAEKYLSNRFAENNFVLAENEEYSINRYTGREFKAINEELRKGSDLGYEAVIDDINRVLERSEIGHEVVLYRGTSKSMIRHAMSNSTFKNIDKLLVENPEALIKRLKGKRFFDYGFTSTSVYKDKAKEFNSGVLMQITTKSDTKGFYVGSISKNKREKEVMLKPGQVMRIKEAFVDNDSKRNGIPLLNIIVEILEN